VAFLRFIPRKPTWAALEGELRPDLKTPEFRNHDPFCQAMERHYADAERSRFNFMQRFLGASLHDPPSWSSQTFSQA
jgi:hypothetical protein